MTTESLLSRCSYCGSFPPPLVTRFCDHFYIFFEYVNLSHEYKNSEISWDLKICRNKKINVFFRSYSLQSLNYTLFKELAD